MFFISKVIAEHYELVQSRKFKGIISTLWNTLVTTGLTSALMVGKVSFCANPRSPTRKHLISRIFKGLQFTGSTHPYIKQSPCPMHWTIPSEGSLSYDSQKMSLYFFQCAQISGFHILLFTEITWESLKRILIHGSHPYMYFQILLSTTAIVSKIVSCYYHLVLCAIHCPKSSLWTLFIYYQQGGEKSLSGKGREIAIKGMQTRTQTLIQSEVSQKEKNMYIQYVNAYMWNLEKGTSELICSTGIETQTQRTDLCLCTLTFKLVESMQHPN